MKTYIQKFLFYSDIFSEILLMGEFIGILGIALLNLT